MCVISSPSTVMLPAEGTSRPQEVEQRRLAGAAGAHEGDEITLVHVKIQSLQHLNLLAAAAVGLVQTANLDET